MATDRDQQSSFPACPHGVMLGNIQGFTILHRCSQCAEESIRDNERKNLSIAIDAVYVNMVGDSQLDHIQWYENGIRDFRRAIREATNV